MRYSHIQPTTVRDDETTGMSSGSFVSDRVAGADDMEDIINDYNKMYGTSFSLQNFRAYYDDVNLRLKKKKAGYALARPLSRCRHVPHRF